MRTEYLLEEQVKIVLAALMPVNRVIMRVCMHTGLRVGDVLELKTEQLKPRFWVTERKTGKRRMIGITADLLADMKDIAGKRWVFESPRDWRKHRTRQGVWKDVKRAAKAFRLPQNVGTHSARKVYAVRLLHEYGDIDKVKRALNHSSIEVTLIYAMADAQLKSKYSLVCHGRRKPIPRGE